MRQPLNACPDCRGRPYDPVAVPAYLRRYGRCLEHARVAERAKAQSRRQRNVATGRNLNTVKVAMAAAVAHARKCAVCGALRGAVQLEAHMPGGGLRTADPNVYVVMCTTCHRRRESEESLRRARGF